LRQDVIQHGDPAHPFLLYRHSSTARAAVVW
jgi:hypothetical protein